MKILFLFILIVSSAGWVQSQNYYWVSFSNKKNTAFSLSSPEKYLSEKAIQRRIRQNIPIDSLDLPVDTDYKKQIIDLGATLVSTSKWLNGITVKTSANDFVEKAKQKNFVKEVQLTKPAATTKSAILKFSENGDDVKIPIDTSVYGKSVYQTSIMNGQFLHNQNFRGQGMTIAVLDGGFYNANSYSALDSLWKNKQILGHRDFVNPAADFFSTHYHGMSVLSCMGGNAPGQLIGTAPKASYWLLRSEDTGSEFLIEEDNWVAAAEFADSVGADIINSSLGYYSFDDPAMNHTYNDMDGKTTRVTRGANIAASRGMLVFASAGNEGNDPWKYLIAPSDGDQVIGVGAVGKDSVAAYFSSYGPASDGDIKPNVSGVGLGTFLQKSDGTLGASNGTSYSSPVLAGMAACLWQAVPGASARDIKAALEKSANNYLNPGAQLGYGIPDFRKAFLDLTKLKSVDFELKGNWTVFPNPVKDRVVLQNNNMIFGNVVRVEMYSLEGKLLKSWIKTNSYRIELSGFESFPNGILLLKIKSNALVEVLKISKTG